MGTPALSAPKGQSLCYYAQRVGEIPANFVAQARVTAVATPNGLPAPQQKDELLEAQHTFKHELKLRRSQLDQVIQQHRDHVDTLRQNAASQLLEMDKVMLLY